MSNGVSSRLLITNYYHSKFRKTLKYFIYRVQKYCFMRINTRSQRLYLVDKTDLFSSFKIFDYLIPKDL